ncbi:aKG-HExxH-type peptide beta-hydroxylase [Pseudonocardia sp.]|uniref:aKG-HExxH-type peptide beta-hydroxylase n=1 Tax=Pseudonocardia sp. TaxID=60912 RepID=UPI003D1229E7
MHARLSTSSALLATRRDLYRAALGTITVCDALLDADAVGDDMLDNPLFRHAVEVAITTGQPVEETVVARVNATRSGRAAVHAGPIDMPVVSTSDADLRFADVIDALHAGELGFLTRSAPEAFNSACKLLQEGLDLAVRIVPDLVLDLFPHVGLIAMLDGARGNSPVHSGSLREFPGLLLVSRPQSAVDAAEMLLHESAHARLYDMLICHHIMFAGNDGCGPFKPPWRARGTEWPLEQTLAALHAYAILSEFADAGGQSVVEQAGSSSLLPHASVRRNMIGKWVLDRLRHFGPDATDLVSGLVGIEASTRPPPSAPALAVSGRATVVPNLTLRFDEKAPCAVATIPGRPPALYVLGRDSGLVLDFLRREQPLIAAVSELETRRNLRRVDAENALSIILDELQNRSLITLDERVIEPKQ